MYFEQECIKKDVGASVATGRDTGVKMKPHVKNGILLVLSFLCQTFFFSYGLVRLFCFVLFFYDFGNICHLQNRVALTM